jgi:hypothetical protein
MKIREPNRSLNNPSNKCLRVASGKVRTGGRLVSAVKPK